ncbi:CRISPR-associated protein [Tannerella forsythia]|uniref:TIGR02221 family CRISPR-associated protein n=1 Tax=Tannerella forsythia TaxID=28112 RepID=UPI00094FFCD0|nr:TIGR02221 family CRISPR-associated protein [Tannerella forsythia]OLQ21867.1 CRISPR-associated protein [Tannerella forsythia]
MVRKVFISFLGTNNYVETHYELNGKVSKPVRFIQEALISSICKKWEEKDKIFIFCTEGACQMNWVDNGQKNTQTDIEKIGLDQRLKDLNLQVKHEKINIKEGFSLEEIWDIFDTVYNKLEAKDEIYFDVTHAFRSIPMFSTILFNYSRSMLDTEVKSIYYGAFEKLGFASEVKKMPLEKRIAPIIDLTGFTNLQQTIQAANDFKNFGKVSSISTLIKTSDNNRINDAIQKLKTELQNLDGYIATCRMADIKSGAFAKKILEVFQKALRSKSITLSEKELLNRINDKISSFKPEPSDENIKVAISWAFEYGMIQQAYTLGQEYIISCVAKKFNDKNPFEKEKDFRMFISGVLNIEDKNIEEDNFKYSLAENKKLTKEILSLDWIKELRKEYKHFADNRNNVNHAKGKKTENEFKTQFKSFHKCLDILGNSN